MSERDLRTGFLVSQASVAWSLTACTAAVVLGAVDGSLVLIAFGVTGLLDGAGSLALVVHFRHALEHSSFSVARERFALRLVSAGLIVVGISTAIESIRRLVANEGGHSSAFGIAIAAASAIVLSVLAMIKLRVAPRVGSGALRADGWLSTTGAVLALVTLVGAKFTSPTGPKWVDPAAALVVGSAAAAVGVLELRRGTKE
jgi:divalent metal cation (Fe/Co/Zn/Cd) transporter